ncbi:hypothetical protein ABIE78_006373 [Sinorhizobium fredii]|uniref:hypothetical protein n=1 Tax=Rhizobium fredii TaxID=380 RepID=UPI00059BD626|nr:hypothetical protein [Sinorhizobium fredii]
MSKGKRHKRTAPSDRFFQMHVWLLNSAAWKATTPFERALYFELKQLHNGQNNGDIALSHREAAVLINCSNKPVAAAFKGLIEKGFIKVATRGSFQWKNRAPGRRSTRWILTEYPVDVPERSLVATKEFMRWKPEEKQRYAESTPLVCPKHTIDDAMVCREHTIKAGVYAHDTR